MLKYKYILKKLIFNTINNYYSLDQICNRLKVLQTCQRAFLQDDLNQFLRFNQAIKKHICLIKIDYLFINFYELNSLKVYILGTFFSKSLFTKRNV